MRYYEVFHPGDDMAFIETSVRRLRNLPEGTRVYAVVTERDGSIVENYELPVENGRVVTRRNGVRNVKLNTALAAAQRETDDARDATRDGGGER